MMKKLIGLFMLSFWLGAAPAMAVSVDNWKDLFTQTEGNVLDWAIASSVEAGYARDMIGGRNAVVGQIPVVYVTRYINADFGYVTGYDAKSRGSLMFGGTIRINRLIEDICKNDLALAQKLVGESKWENIWLGPWIAHGFTSGEVLGGIKGGLKFDKLFGTW